ncbi:MAG: hypothetical protein A2293_01370 [Elusimicrobia bacterium RIFOXYB2_FULL_49_7]|nr:MAG: hypothetical protein A2293_01370 [Elusimicrobia bacterium RIFOXYB2_FULL_49_7]
MFPRYNTPLAPLVTFAMLVGTLVFSVSAAGAAPLTLTECFSLAEGYSKPLAIQKERFEQARQLVNQAAGDRLPFVAVGLSRDYRESVGNAGEEGTSSRLSVTQRLFSGFRTRESLSAARSRSVQEELSFCTIKRTLFADVSRSFYDVAQQDAEVKNVSEIIFLMEERIRELKERVRLGKSRESEVLAVQSQTAQLRAQLDKINGDRANALESLSLLIGRGADAIQISDERTVAAAQPVDVYLQSALQRSDIRAAQEEVAARKSGVTFVKGARLPSLNFDGNWYLSRSGTLSGADWGALLSLTMPIYQGGVLHAKVKEEEYRLREAQESEEQLKRITAAGMRKLYNDYTAAAAQAASYNEAYERSSESYRLQLRDYRLGLVSNMEVLQALLAMFDTKRNQARMDLQIQLNKVLLEIAAEMGKQ